MPSRAIVLGILFLFGVHGRTLADPPDVGSEFELHLTGAQLLACTAALQEFAKFGWNTKEFDIFVRELDASLEVIFVPRLRPEEKAKIHKGGGSDAGNEVHYFVNKADMKIERTRYAR